MDTGFVLNPDCLCKHFFLPISVFYWRKYITASLFFNPAKRIIQMISLCRRNDFSGNDRFFDIK